MYQVDKTIFKIGSLDQLMQMNEQAGKLDMQIDMACKKYEKIAFDSGATELRYTNEQDNTQRKIQLIYSFSAYAYRGLQRLHQEMELERPQVQPEDAPARTLRGLPQGKSFVRYC